MLDIPGDGDDGSHFVQRIQDFGFADIARMNNQVGRLQGAQSLWTEQSVGVGDEANLRGPGFHATILAHVFLNRVITGRLGDAQRPCINQNSYPRRWAIRFAFIPPIVFTGPAVCATLLNRYRLFHAPGGWATAKRPATEFVANPLLQRYWNTYRSTSLFAR